MDPQQPYHPIKIVHLLPGLRVGGAERVVLNLHSAFDPSHIDSKILYWDDRPEMLESPTFSGLVPRTHKLDLPKVVSLSSVSAVYRYLRQSKAELLHTHLTDADLLGFFAARLLNIPHVVTIHSYPFPSFKRHCLRYKMMTLLGTHVVCVSQLVKNHALKAAGIRPSKISTIYSGINLDAGTAAETSPAQSGLRRQLGIDKNAFVVGCVSRVVHDKGHEYLVAAAPRVVERCKNVVFLIVGDGVLREPLSAQARRLGVEKNILFTGSRSDVPQLLALMDVFVYPSEHESLALAVIEAMAAAKPVISANFPVITELITHEKNGIIVPLRDSTSLADAIIDLYAKPDKRNALALSAKETAQSFSVTRTAQNLEALYLSMFPVARRRFS